MTLMVPREPIAELVERLIAERDDPLEIDSRRNGGGISVLAMELAAAGGTADGWVRRLHSIRTGHYVDRKKRVKVQAEVTFDVVDRMLAALDLTHLWFTDFAEHLPPAEDVPRVIVPYPESVVAETRCPRCERKLDDREPAGTVEQFGHCALCVAKLTRTRLRHGKWTFALVFGLYERYLLTGESDEHLLRAHGVPATSTNAGGIIARWDELGWPRRTRGQSKRLNAKLHPKPPLMPLILREHGGEPLVRQLHALHWHRQQSINSLCRELAPQWGVSVSRLTSAVSVAFAKLGLPAHSRVTMTVRASYKNGLSPRDHRKRSKARKAAGLTVHGMKERQPLCGTFGHTVKHKGRAHGAPCPKPVLKGKTACVAHDPERQEKITANLARMREVAHDPTKYEPLEPLQAELLEAAGEVGWAKLDRLHGTSKGYLSKLARGRTVEHESGRIGRHRARRIRVVIARAKADALLDRVRELREEAA